jgi:hypothetical protein
MRSTPAAYRSTIRHPEGTTMSATPRGFATTTAAFLLGTAALLGVQTAAHPAPARSVADSGGASTGASTGAAAATGAVVPDNHGWGG